MDNNDTPEAIEEEKTVPVPAETMREVQARPRRPLNPLWDCDNGVDERGRWGRSW
jgi:hypothetical protein